MAGAFLSFIGSGVGNISGRSSPAKKGRRETLRLRVVSSHPSHEKMASIKLTDDVLIMTTPTAINAFNYESERMDGKKAKTPFFDYLFSLKDERILVVLDEAHHAPAYGCRNLLLQLKQLIPKMWLLGLTATPTYTDVTRRGWLGKIFEDGILYDVRKDTLQMQNILARENYIQRQTPVEMEVDDELDVLINVRMLTEGTDVPNTKSFF